MQQDIYVATAGNSGMSAIHHWLRIENGAATGCHAFIFQKDKRES